MTQQAYEELDLVRLKQHSAHSTVYILWQTPAEIHVLYDVEVQYDAANCTSACCYRHDQSDINHCIRQSSAQKHRAHVPVKLVAVGLYHIMALLPPASATRALSLLL
jgi:hypothetical protein